MNKRSKSFSPDARTEVTRCKHSFYTPLDQMYEISDRVTVLRICVLVGEYELKDFPLVQLIYKMFGKDLDDVSTLQKKKMQDEKSDVPPIYEAVGLSSTNCPNAFDFKISKGEVNGFTGLLGSGRSESVRLFSLPIKSPAEKLR